MDNKWYDECSVISYPHNIKFCHIDGGSISYYVDRNVSDYISKLQAQLSTSQNKNRELDIKNMILQSKIDNTIKLLEDFKINSKDVENEWAVEICELIIRKLKENNNEEII